MVADGMRTKTDLRSRWMAAAVLMCGIAQAACGINIVRPKFGAPEFAEPNGTFRVEVTAPAGLASNGWSATLVNDLRPWPGCALQRAVCTPGPDSTSEASYALTFRLPPDAPPEVFSLIVRHAEAGTATNRHAVSVVTALDRSFYIIHYADPQSETYRAAEASGMAGTHGSLEEVGWHVPVFNLIHPRFVFDTGDEIDDGFRDTVARYGQYLDALNPLNSPVLITRGNNDAGDPGHWKTNIGPATFSITMGSFYVCMKDYTSDDRLAWFTNDYALSFSNTGILFRLFGQHYYSGDDAFAPPAGQEPDLMLVGHKHESALLQSKPYPILCSGPAFKFGHSSFLEFTRCGRGWTCSLKTNDPGAVCFDPVGDAGAGCVACGYAAPNDGMSLSNSVVITNRLGFDFWDGRVRFLMRRAPGGYQVRGGKVLAEYDTAAGPNTAVLVQVDIVPSNVTHVSIAPSSEGDKDLSGHR